MEKKLNAMFDYHRFESNTRLARIIADTESRYAKALSDEDLEMVSAAGENSRPSGNNREI